MPPSEFWKMGTGEVQFYLKVKSKSVNNANLSLDQKNHLSDKRKQLEEQGITVV